MKKRFLAASIVLAAVAGTGLVPLAAQAQNIAVANGKPVPKARADAVIAQVQKQAAARALGTGWPLTTAMFWAWAASGTSPVPATAARTMLAARERFFMMNGSLSGF